MGRVCGVLGSVLLLSGCSLALVDRPPPGEGPLPRGACATSVMAPLFDASGAAFWGFAGGVNLAAGLKDEPETRSVSHEATGAAALLIAGVYTYSAVSGFKRTSACRERRSLSEQAIADHLRSIRLSTPVEPGGPGLPTADRSVPLGATHPIRGSGGFSR